MVLRNRKRNPYDRSVPSGVIKPFPRGLTMPDPKPLTKDGKLKMDPVFVRGGDDLKQVAIVYTLQETPTQMSLMRLNLADGTSERLHPQATSSEFEASFTPDMRFYAFIQSRGNLNLKMVIRDVKQNKEAVFDPGGGFASLRRPTIAPDGGRVVFSIPGGNGQQIVSVNNQAQDKKTLMASGLNSWPAYSPDSKRIAFGSTRDGGDYEIYVMNADGNDVRRLTDGPGLDGRPAWSPDGRRLAFTSNRDGNYNIYVMNTDGTSTRRLSDNAERDDYAVWHPDGRHIVVVSERAGRFDLYLLEVP